MHEVEQLAKQIGVCFETIQDKPLQHGELYIAHRNGKAVLLTCKLDDRQNRWVIPVENAYLYDTCECFRVVEK